MKKIMFVLAFVLAALFCLPSCAAPDAEPECSCRLYIDYNSYIPDLILSYDITYDGTFDVYNNVEYSFTVNDKRTGSVVDEYSGNLYESSFKKDDDGIYTYSDEITVDYMYDEVAESSDFSVTYSVKLANKINKRTWLPAVAGSVAGLCLVAVAVFAVLSMVKSKKDSRD